MLCQKPSWVRLIALFSKCSGLIAASLIRMQKRPWRCFRSALHDDFNHRGRVEGVRFLQCRAKLIGAMNSVSVNAKAFCEFHEIRIRQLRTDQVALIARQLIAPHVAVGVVVEYADNHTDAILRCGCEFLHAE